MLNEKTVRGTNFTCFHAGPMEGWTQFRLPLRPMPQAKPEAGQDAGTLVLPELSEATRLVG